MVTRHYKRYALTALTVAYTLSFMDRALMGLFMQPIKEELLLTDTQLGFLTGIAFALFYATLGIPIARWADRGNRVTIISLAMALWGGMVMLCGFVTSFAQLVLVRIGAAVGEAGCFPPSYSLIGDYFPVAERPRALSILMMGISFSAIISYLFGGWLNELYGWRVAFIVVGLPGLLIALLIKFTVREPRNQPSEAANTFQEDKSGLLPFRDVLATLWQQKTYRYIVIALTLANFVGIGVSQWYATFFIRNHGMTVGELGLWLGLLGGVGGAVGTYVGGYVVGRYMANNSVAQLRFVAIGIALIFPCTILMVFVSSERLSLMMLAPLFILGLFLYGPIVSLIQSLVQDRMRAMAAAVSGLVLNLIGMGLGPQAVGILSDLLNPLLGIDALRVAMATVSLATFPAAYCFWIAGRTVEGDLLPQQLRNSLKKDIQIYLDIESI